MPDTEPTKPNKQGYGADPLHHYGWLTPLFWHGMTPGVFWAMVLRNRCRLSVRGALTCLTITGVGLFHLVGKLATDLLYGRRLRLAKPSQPPLFVLGHWRSGTTLLHELLIRDPRHVYPTTFECFAPYHFLLSERYITPLIGWLLPKKRPMDNVATGWDRPQEDEFALCSLGLPTPYRSWAFPQNGPVCGEWLTLDNVSPDDRRRWGESLRRFVGTLSLKRPGRVILKSPPHTARIKTILEHFPDARFVHISRDPMKLFPSTVRLWKSLSDVQSLQGYRAEYDWIEEEVFSNLTRMYEAYDRDRSLIPEGRLVEMSYEDLVADPKASLRAVYEQLDLGSFDNAEAGVDAYLAEEKDYKTNRFEMPAEVRERIAERWGAYAERWGYEG
ncbi:Sulfotransferase domain protein [Botrimarina colliarenosi]|uniref:Sulfotransferase domain protein n=1 Tax=Botrimarina colliarenosi TaxID=2528001 RepID=A0A5C6AKX4_9BACT|nr:sulfotransferase [Botrimarina colliarenosi]TWU00300.1 Sulfotransferase domain protein [Botrimarina colliarenosi]